MINTHLYGDVICAFESDSINIVSHYVWIFRKNRNSIRAIFPVNFSYQIITNIIGFKENHNVSNGFLRFYLFDNFSQFLFRHTLDVPKAFRLLFQYIKSILTECLDNFLGSG